MNKLFTYRFLTKSTILLLLVGQCWATIAPYIDMLTQESTELLEHTTSEDNESEEEEKREKKEDKYQIELLALSNNTFIINLRNYYLKLLSSSLCSKVPTPPPESFPIV